LFRPLERRGAPPFGRIGRRYGCQPAAGLRVDRQTVTREVLSATTLHETVQRVAPEAEDAVMTLAEQLIQQGRTEGRAEGRTEGRTEGRAEGRAEATLGLLRRQLLIKFGMMPSRYESKLEAASEQQLDVWAERLLVADRIELVFAERD
jgi:hypothetical protein